MHEPGDRMPTASNESRTAAASGASTSRRRALASRARTFAPLALGAAALLFAGGAHAQADGPEPAPQTKAANGLGSDIKAYVTAPLHAGRRQWIAFGAVIGGIAVAHHYDEQFRNHIGPVRASARAAGYAGLERRAAGSADARRHLGL